MKTTIRTTFDAKTRRLVMFVPFYLNDLVRAFPSRRFNPKDKSWRVELTRVNINHLRENSALFDLDEPATIGIAQFEANTHAPVRLPFPRDKYSFKSAPVPYDPMPHQNKMLDLAWNLPAAAWFAKMGTGKTFAAIHLAFARWKLGLIDGLLILAPSTLRHTWRKELAKYATAEYDYRIHETKMPGLQDFYNGKNTTGLRVLAVSVEGLGVSEKLYDSVCGFIQGRIMVICDESSRIKNPKALRTQRAIMLGAACTYRVILNGTPIALGIHDLWSQYEFLDPNIIGCGDYWAFRTKYIELGGFNNKQIVGYRHVDELMAAILPYTCEVGKDVLNLPPKVPKIVWSVATQEQKALFRLVVKGKHPDPGLVIKVDNVLERMLRLRQIVGGWLPRSVPRLKIIDGEEVEVWETVLEPLQENPKMDAFLGFIEDHVQTSKFVIWSTFTHEIEAIREILAGKYGPQSVECYYGATDKDYRSVVEDRYCNDPRLRFFVGNPTAAGLGLTLISGEEDVHYYYSGTNAYIDRTQSEDRSHRIGQSRTVVIADGVMEGTVDEIIQASIAAKMDVEEYLMTRIAAGADPEKLLLGEMK